MIKENKKFQEIEEYKTMAFFVKSNQKMNKVHSPILVKKSLVK